MQIPTMMHPRFGNTPDATPPIPAKIREQFERELPELAQTHPEEFSGYATSGKKLLEGLEQIRTVVIPKLINIITSGLALTPDLATAALTDPAQKETALQHYAASEMGMEEVTNLFRQQPGLMKALDPIISAGMEASGQRFPF